MLRTVLGYISRIDRCFVNYRKANLKDLNDVYPVLHMFISYVCRHPGCLQEELIEELCVDKSTVAHHLMKLEEKGYVERRVDTEDQRRRRVFPTEKAMSIHPAMHEVYENFRKGIMEGLTEEEQQEIIRLSEKMYENAIRLSGGRRNEK